MRFVGESEISEAGPLILLVERIEKRAWHLIWAYLKEAME